MWSIGGVTLLVRKSRNLKHAYIRLKDKSSDGRPRSYLILYVLRMPSSVNFYIQICSGGKMSHANVYSRPVDLSADGGSVSPGQSGDARIRAQIDAEM